jgi:hypothetical protein
MRLPSGNTEIRVFRFYEIKRFTYYLYRDDRVWYIYNYEVRNLGTE